MPVYTVMAEEPDATPFQLYRTASSEPEEALRRLEQFRRSGFINIKIYRETEPIDENELRQAAAPGEGA